MLFKRCPWNALEQVAAFLRSRGETSEAGYIERWIDAVQPRSGDSSTDGSDGGSDLSLESIPRPDVAGLGGD